MALLTSSAVVPWTPPTTIATGSSCRKTPADLLALLRLCSDAREARQVHAAMLKTSALRHPHHAARLGEFYAVHPCGDLDLALSLLSLPQTPSTFLLNSLLRGHLLRSLHLPALLLLRRILLLGVPPDEFTLTYALKTASLLRPPPLSLARQIHALLLLRGLAPHHHHLRNKLIHLYATSGAIPDARAFFRLHSDPDVVAWNSLLEGLARHGPPCSARQLFDQMPHRDVVSWNTMIALLVDEGRHDDALAFFRRMQETSPPVAADRITLVTLLSAAAHLGALAQGKWLHAYAKRNAIALDAKLTSALVNMYSKCGCVYGAIAAFEDPAGSRSVDTWNAMIAGLTVNGLGQRAVHLFRRMESSGIRPNSITFASMLNACSHCGLIAEATGFFEKMATVYGVEPDITHFGSMVDLYSRAGMFDKVEEIMHKMPMDPDHIMLKAILAGCRIHKNLELGEKVGLRFIELAPDDHTGYVLLSNLHAAAGNWDRARSIRDMMGRRGIMKIPGCSSIECGGRVHEFVAGDASHARRSEIKAMLDEMAGRLEEAGYKPDTTQVLLEVEEEEAREKLLRHHSEKVAIAFGLINTAPGTTLHVVKNLRVCSDCHNAIKLLSRIYRRDITVRDANRFHCFKDGVCSCNDYW